MWKKLFLVFLSVNTLVFGRELLPPFPDTLCIEPNIPDTFEMGPNPDLYAGVIWGEKEAIHELLDSHKIENIFFFVRLSGDIIQQDPTSFGDEFTLPERFSMMGCTDVEIRKTFWKKHPVLIANYLDHEGRAGYRAWIGLNSCLGGWVLSVSFQYPESQTAPTDEQLAIWTTFLNSPDLSFMPNSFN